ncbi:MAG: hypothetical protein NTX15_11985 [Candidatus Kapabacteria bacterium]|nr:hypothetical protein [Candidatus Kapabacteria bacterium]
MAAGFIVTATLAFALALSGCDGATVTQPQDVVFPDSNVRFRGQVQPYFAVTCANGGCHNDMVAAGGIRLTTYSTVLFDRPNLVVPSKPDESLIIQIMSGILNHPAGNLTQRIAPTQVRGIRKWISEGALNN